MGVNSNKEFLTITKANVSCGGRQSMSKPFRPNTCECLKQEF